MKNNTTEKSQLDTPVEETEKGVISRGQAIKKVGIITLTAASMMTLLATNKALAASTPPYVAPDNAGNGFA